MEESADRIPEREKGDRVCVDVGGVGESGEAAVGRERDRKERHIELLKGFERVEERLERA